MNQSRVLQWVLRIGVAGEFLGHGILALQGKAQWVGWISKMTGADAQQAVSLLFLIGLMDVAVAMVALLRPIPAVLAWGVIWGFWTALVRPLVGESILDFIERSANWAAPLALILARGWPRSVREWFR
jgi:hypothetical protein